MECYATSSAVAGEQYRSIPYRSLPFYCSGASLFMRLKRFILSTLSQKEFEFLTLYFTGSQPVKGSLYV